MRLVATSKGNYRSILNRNQSTLTPVTASVKAHVAAMHNYSSAAPSTERTSNSSRSYTSTGGYLARHRYAQSRSRSDVTSSHASTTQVSSVRRQKSAPQYVRAPYSSSTKVRGTTMRHIYQRKHGNKSGRRSKVSAAAGGGATIVEYEDLNEEGKREYHNSLERKRREDLRELQRKLWEVLPKSPNEKPAKLTVLKRGRSHIMNLRCQYSDQKDHYMFLARKNAMLRAKLRHLKTFRDNNKLSVQHSNEILEVV